VRFNTVFTRALHLPPLVPILSDINPVHSIPSYLSTIHQQAPLELRFRYTGAICDLHEQLLVPRLRHTSTPTSLDACLQLINPRENFTLTVAVLMDMNLGKDSYFWPKNLGVRRIACAYINLAHFLLPLLRRK
jgi:hypothetical protein